jgi:cytochrome o ubiquinol oxidase subunit 2
MAVGERILGRTVSRTLRIAALAAGALALGGCRFDLLDPAGPVEAGERLILLDSVVIMLAIVLPTMAATLAFAWWFRASNAKARYLPDWAYSGRIELVVWSIPVLVIMFLGGLAWISAHDLDPAQPVAGRGKPLQVEVVSLDWKWLFIYPDQGIASVNRLVIPVGAPVRFSITSGSVMTAFFIPRLGSMIYAMNGMVTTLDLEAGRPGDYLGEASQFSGDGFTDMRFTASAVSPADFAAWAAAAHAGGPVLDAVAYRNLSQQGVPPAPFTYSAVAPGLFQAIATQKLPPGPGPATDAGRSP